MQLPIKSHNLDLDLMKWLGKLIKYLFVLFFIGAITGGALVAAAYWHFKTDLPDIQNLKDVQLQVPLRVYSKNKQLIAQFGEKRRIPITYNELPEQLIQAFLSAEDHHFFKHIGIDPIGLSRAAISLITTGKKRQGGSTITMQVARNFYLTRKRTYTRKIREIFLALRIEQELSKQEILTLYLNKIYLGHRSYGIGAAAQVYYGKSLAQLDLTEIAMLAGLPKAPSKYNPITNPERAKIRRNYVLRSMQEQGYISAETAAQAKAAAVSAVLHRAKIELEAPYVAEMVRKHMVNTYGTDAYTAGYNVYTTIDGKLQKTAQDALRKTLNAYDQRHGWRGAEKHFDQLPTSEPELDELLTSTPSIAELKPGIVLSTKEQSASVYIGHAQTITLNWESMQWASPFKTTNRRGKKPKQAADILQPGDLIRVKSSTNEAGETLWHLQQVPDVAGAIVSVNPLDGAITALSGGYDFYHSKFNRAIQAKRQPGSGFKAFIYSAALEAGYTAASIINDAPVVTADSSLEGDWRPENYSGKFFGPTRLRFALTKSRNLVSIRLLRAMGVEHAIAHIEHFGFDPATLPHNLSLALGSGEVTPLQMARGYAVLANGGYLVDPYYIVSIDRNNAETLYTARPLTVCTSCAQAQPQEALNIEALTSASTDDLPVAPRTISAGNRFIMYSMMQDVITRGTARKALVLKRKDLAGKTGTSNDQRDAWFNGYNQSVVTNVWVGFDNNAKLGRGEVGGRAALPAWIDFMRVALQDIPDESPQMPDNMVSVRIDAETGLRVGSASKNALFEVFRPEHVPSPVTTTVTSDPFSQQPGTTAPVDDLF